MSKFHIGQRVKKVRGASAGLTATVFGTEIFSAGQPGIGAGRLTRRSDIQVVYDTEWINLDGDIRPQSSISHGVADEFEPLDKPKHEAGSWEVLRELGLDPERLLDAVATEKA